MNWKVMRRHAVTCAEVDGSSVHADGTGAAAAYELVALDLLYRIDAEASASGKHIRSTTEALCSDLAAEPLSREEVYNAITYAAEHGHVPAQLNYAVYAVRMFEDERNEMDPEPIRHYKESTLAVRRMALFIAALYAANNLRMRRLRPISSA
ncbi:hypothetical protein RZA67_10000 [Stenotrophomonas sp. C3(2023)]|uniref:hypothetical protein n=1 Tax=Stenotrophomonas sp. C3(2023) TaxID=3080277 RepID=UPI00293CC1F2|nr:hypothetical protein [Stenotrophomonas sp. C3(2023)]MDV3469061.1 hypothetical protein [Stenotrophomonas sp. C3(2023)]